VAGQARPLHCLSTSNDNCWIFLCRSRNLIDKKLGVVFYMLIFEEKYWSVMRIRKQLRLSKFNYSLRGSYFVTICVDNMQCCLSKIDDGELILNSFGRIAQSQWQWLDQQYPYVSVENFIVMPNHVHAIVDIIPKKRYGKILSLSQLIGAYKTLSTAKIRKAGFVEFSWHRSFFDHIIRGVEDYQNIVDYINSNPANWSSDRYFGQSV
jgi:putative transposase